MNLRDVQRQFMSAVMDGNAFPHDAIAAGLHVHANNVRGQLAAALRDTYEKTRLWLGDEAFDRHASTYIDAYKPAAWSLDDYGADFPAHLLRACPDAPEVCDIAWIDWALRDAFSGADAEALDVSMLAVEDWDSAEFIFVPTLRMRRLATNAPALWAALAKGTRPDAPFMLPGTGVRVWRHALTPRFQAMSCEECDCLDLALAGGTFAELCELLSDRASEEDIAARAGILLRSWLDDGMLVAVGSRRQPPQDT